MPLGEAAKGSGQCNAGSGLATPDGGHVPGPTQYCLSGGTTVYECSQGNDAYWSCQYGLTVSIPPGYQG
jgi:hypothetical protein